MIASGKPYVSINADHSDPGRILKYAPKPYLFVHKHMNYEQICIKKKKIKICFTKLETLMLSKYQTEDKELTTRVKAHHPDQ